MRVCYWPQLPLLRWRGRGFLVGLSGAIGSGKTTAALCFEELGAVALQADRLAHAALHSPELQPHLESAFGTQILDRLGQVSHTRLAELVFGNPEKRLLLNSLVHPIVQRRYEEVVASLSPTSLLVYDVPLLFENDLEGQFDLTVVISASEQIRWQRVERRSHWSYAQFQRREAAQLSLAEKERRANLVILNERGAADLRQAITSLYREIMKRSPKNGRKAT